MRYNLPCVASNAFVHKIVNIEYKGYEPLTFNIDKFNKSVLFPKDVIYTVEDYENTSNAIFMLLNRYLATLDGEDDEFIRSVHVEVKDLITNFDLSKVKKQTAGKARTISKKPTIDKEELQKRQNLFKRRYKSLLGKLFTTKTYDLDNIISFIHDSNINIPKTYNRSDVLNSNHTPDKTYFKEDMIDLMAFTIILKMIMVLTSSFTEYIDDTYKNAGLRLEVCNYLPNTLLNCKPAIKLRKYLNLSFIESRGPLQMELQLKTGVTDQNQEGWLFAEAITYRLPTSRCGIDKNNILSYLYRHISSKLDPKVGTYKDKRIGDESRNSDVSSSISDEYRCKYTMSVAEQQMLKIHTKKEYLLPCIEFEFPKHINSVIDEFSKHNHPISNLQRQLIQITLYRYLPEDAYWLADEKTVKELQYISYCMLCNSHPVIATLILSYPLLEPISSKGHNTTLSPEVQALKAECLKIYDYKYESSIKKNVTTVVEDLVRGQMDKATVMEVTLPSDAPHGCNMLINDDGYINFRSILQKALYEFYIDLDNL